MPLKGFFKTTSVRLCKLDFRLRAIWISASKNRSNFPANALFARRAPLAAVWMQPNDSVHHETMRLVSLSFRLRSRIAVVLSIGGSNARARYRYYGVTRTCHRATERPIPLVPLFHLRPGVLQGRIQAATKENVEVLVPPGIGMIGASRGFNTCELLTLAATVATENDDALAGIIARAPKPVTLVIADRFR